MTETSTGSRPWAIRLITLLLLVQALGLVVLNVQSIAHVLQEEPEITSLGDILALYNLSAVRDLPPAEAQVTMSLTTTFLLIPPVFMGLLAAIGFIFRWRWGWVLAMLTQIVILSFSLIILYEFFWPIVIAAVLVAGGYIYYTNCRMVVLLLGVGELPESSKATFSLDGGHALGGQFAPNILSVAFGKLDEQHSTGRLSVE